MPSDPADTLLSRRRILGTLGTAFAVLPFAALAGCSGSTLTSTSNGAGGGGGAGGAGGAGSTSSSSSSSGAGTGGSGGSAPVTECSEIPEETAGPYPDKTGMLNNTAFYRKDITEGKTGLPLTVAFQVVTASSGCAAVAGATVDVWHCDALGVYSEYTGQPGVTDDESSTTFLRGLQKTDGNGKVGFTTIYPGWYAGRATHIHIEVYVSGKLVKTTQLAFPEDINTLVYGSVSPYQSKGQNPTKNTGDMVFEDGDDLQVATMTGDTTSGYTASLLISIPA